MEGSIGFQCRQDQGRKKSIIGHEEPLSPRRPNEAPCRTEQHETREKRQMRNSQEVGSKFTVPEAKEFKHSVWAVTKVDQHFNH